MITAKEMYKFSHPLHVLYVEDDAGLRNEMVRFFEPLFARVDSAADGLEGLEKYNRHFYDLVITDINMPKMDGIEMIRQIREIHIEQKVVAISAYNEPKILVELIRAGIHSFLLKPARQQSVVTTLYPVCRDAHAQRTNMELLEALNEEREKLKKQLRALEAQTHAADTKHRQLEMIAERSAPAPSPAIADFFAGGPEEVPEKIVFMKDEGDELNEIFGEIPERLLRYATGGGREEFTKITASMDQAATIMFRYSPFLDPLAQCFLELARTIESELEAFSSLVEKASDEVVALFDAVCLDMERYVEEFSVKTMAVANIHQLHLPTVMSIKQINGMIKPEEVEGGGFIEFF